MMRTVDLVHDPDTGEGTVKVSHSSRHLVLENDNDDLPTGSEMPDGRLRCGGDLVMPKLRLRKDSERADDPSASIGLPMLQAWDEYRSDSTRDDSLFETVVLSRSEADGTSLTEVTRSAGPSDPRGRPPSRHGTHHSHPDPKL